MCDLKFRGRNKLSSKPRYTTANGSFSVSGEKRLGQTFFTYGRTFRLRGQIFSKLNWWKVFPLKLISLCRQVVFLKSASQLKLGSFLKKDIFHGMEIWQHCCGKFY